MDRLKMKRTTRRAQNTKLIQEASALLENDDATVRQIDSICEMLKSNNEELRKINDEMESHISDEAFEAEYATVIEYEDNATRILAELQSKRRQHSETSPVSPHIEVRDVPASMGPSERPGAKLPKLTINPFAVESLERSDFAEEKGYDEATHPKDNESPHFHSAVPTSSVLHLHCQVAITATNSSCNFCKSTQHLTESCSMDLSLQEKRKLLSADMRCFRCTCKGHRARDCRRRVTCSGCKGRHATTMCDPDKLRRMQREDIKMTGEVSRPGNEKTLTTVKKRGWTSQGSTDPKSSKTFHSRLTDMTTQLETAEEFRGIIGEEKGRLQRYETRLGERVPTRKSQMLEPAFHASQKRVIQAKDYALHEAQALRNVNEQATSMETKMAELRLKLREEQTAREREHRAHENKLKELQRLLSEKQTFRENIEDNLEKVVREAAQAHMTKEYESKIQKLTQDLDGVRKRLRVSEEKLTLIFPVLLKMQQLGMEQCEIELEKQKRQPGHVMEHQQTMRRETEMGSLENRLKELSQAGRTHDWLRMQDCAAIQQVQERPSLPTREDATSSSAARIGPKNTELPSQQIKPEREDIAGPLWQQGPAAETVEAACAESPMDLLAYICELAGEDVLSLHAKWREKLWHVKD
ncbi:uncharacterized protein LOC119380305 [Rhipicephalus sanguineus]|uniref:uncharacterized protein LOC119380305 n=1 Tax=Rhipicephalus sanguineus TaxID=34632 RepID=UPI001893D045|nr:uncharacterized protein LOC119380305 [Rhipicephalus sanguineus]